MGLDRKVIYAMGSNFGDLDNDGWLDFYVGTGNPDLRSVIPNRMFRNVEGKRFEEVTLPGGFGHIQKGHGAAFADLDRDGDQDVYMVIGWRLSGRPRSPACSSRTRGGRGTRGSRWSWRGAPPIALPSVRGSKSTSSLANGADANR